MSDLPVDCLLGTVGLFPTQITHRQLRAAETLPDKFTSRASAWWARDKQAPFKEIKAGDLDKLFDKLSAPPTQSELSGWLADAGDEADHIEDLYLAIKGAREYLVQAWPRIQIRTFAGMRLADLSIDDAAEVASLFAVLNEPTTILDEMDSGTLSPSQATAFRKIYPSLYGHYLEALQMGAAKKGRDLSWVPNESEEIALAILTGRPEGALPYEADEEKPKDPKQAADLGASAARTQADQSSKPVGVK